MANHQGIITIQLDRLRRLKYDVNALAEFEGVVGQSLPSLFSLRDGESPEEMGRRVGGFRVARALLWAGLLFESPRLTLHEAGNLIESAQGESLEEKLNFVAQTVSSGFQSMRRDDRGKKESIPGVSASSGIGGTGASSSA